MSHFREVQPLYRNPAIWIGVAGLAAAFAANFSTRSEVEPGGHPLGLAMPFMIAAWLFWMRLETEVRDAGLHLRFRALWFPKTFSWGEIESAEAVRYRPLLHYGGWGIRRGFREWAWNVSGSEGVRLHFRDGSSFLIGSAQSERLAAAIRARLPDPAAPAIRPL